MAVIAFARTLPAMEPRPGLKDVRRPAALMHAYITLSLLCGIRTEEARALRWAHVDLDGDPAARPPVPPHVAVWRSVRTHGETKTERSRRETLCTDLHRFAFLLGASDGEELFGEPTP